MCQNEPEQTGHWQMLAVASYSPVKIQQRDHPPAFVYIKWSPWNPHTTMKHWHCRSLCLPLQNPFPTSAESHLTPCPADTGNGHLCRMVTVNASANYCEVYSMSSMLDQTRLCRPSTHHKPPSLFSPAGEAAPHNRNVGP